MPRLLFISLLILCGYYSRAAFLWKIWRHHRVQKNEMVMVARLCQQYAQPLSPAVSRGNDSYNTVPALAWWPSSEIIHTSAHVLCLLAATTVRGWCSYFIQELQIVQLLFKAVTIRGWRLFKEIWYVYVLASFPGLTHFLFFGLRSVYHVLYWVQTEEQKKKRG